MNLCLAEPVPASGKTLKWNSGCDVTRKQVARRLNCLVSIRSPLIFADINYNKLLPTNLIPSYKRLFCCLKEMAGSIIDVPRNSRTWRGRRCHRRFSKTAKLAELFQGEGWRKRFHSGMFSHPDGQGRRVRRKTQGGIGAPPMFLQICTQSRLLLDYINVAHRRPTCDC